MMSYSVLVQVEAVAGTFQVPVVASVISQSAPAAVLANLPFRGLTHVGFMFDSHCFDKLVHLWTGF